jgi:hypothetical protein
VVSAASSSPLQSTTALWRPANVPLLQRVSLFAGEEEQALATLATITSVGEFCSRATVLPSTAREGTVLLIVHGLVRLHHESIDGQPLTSALLGGERESYASLIWPALVADAAVQAIADGTKIYRLALSSFSEFLSGHQLTSRNLTLLLQRQIEDLCTLIDDLAAPHVPYGWRGFWLSLRNTAPKGLCA